MKYQILQIKDFTNCDYIFDDYDRAVKRGFDLSHYEVVYEGTVDQDPEDINEYADIENILEELFITFNVNHPVDYKGHSLSVSDIICLDGAYYYVDRLGYKKL